MTGQNIRIIGHFGKNFDERIAIRDSIKEIYAIRSQFIHHGANEKLVDEYIKMNEFLKLAFLAPKYFSKKN